jgi:hypothetical protein
MAGVTTSTTLAALIQERMGEAMLAARQVALFWPGSPAHNILQVEDLTNVANGSADFNHYATLTAYDVVEGEDFSTVQQMTVTSTNVAPTEKQVVTWMSDKALRALGSLNNSGNRMRKEALEHAAAHAAKMDKSVFALSTSLTLGASTTGTDLTNAKLKEAVNVCRTLNMPKPWVGILHTEQYNNLAVEASSPFLSIATSGQLAQDMYENFELVRAYGVNWFITNDAYNDATDVWGMILSSRALGLVLKALPTEPTTEYDQSRRATEISTVADWGVGVIEAAGGVYIRSDAP